MRATISTPETMKKIASMLENPDQGVRQSAVKTIATLILYSEFSPSAILVGSDSQPDDLCAMISTPEMMRKIISMLGEEDWVIQQSAIKIVLVFAQYGEFSLSANQIGTDSQPDELRATISTPETMQKILSMLENRNEGVRQSAVKTVAALVQYGEFFPPQLY
jgi:hypothetical protein